MANLEGIVKFGLLSAPVILFLVTFFYWPLSSILLLAISNPLSQWVDELSSPLFLKFAKFTITQALLTVLFSTALGLPAGYFLARSKPILKNTLRTLLTVPFLFPPLAVLVGFISIFQSNSPINSIVNHIPISPYSFWGIIIVHTLYNISVITRITESGFSSEPQNYHQIAQILGASKFRRWRTITLPHIRPALEAAMLLVFLYSFNSFAMVLVLGQVKLQTIEVMIYTASRLRLNYVRASILAVFQLILNVLVVIFYATRRNYSLYEGEFAIPPSSERVIPSFYLILLTVITWLPILQLIWYISNVIRNGETAQLFAFFSGEFSSLLGTSSIRILGNTLYFAFTVAAFAITFSTLLIISTGILNKNSNVNKLFIVLTLLPMGTSAITLSFGLLQTHGKSSFFSNYVFIYIISAHLIAALPFAYRVLASSWNRVPIGLIQVSKTLGADAIKTFTDVILPYIKSGLIVAILFSFAISIGEFGATFFLARGEWITISLGIERLLGSQNIILPSVYALFLILLSLIIFLIMEKIGDVELRI